GGGWGWGRKPRRPGSGDGDLTFVAMSHHSDGHPTIAIRATVDATMVPATSTDTRPRRTPRWPAGRSRSGPEAGEVMRGSADYQRLSVRRFNPPHTGVGEQQDDT